MDEKPVRRPIEQPGSIVDLLDLFREAPDPEILEQYRAASRAVEELRRRDHG